MSNPTSNIITGVAVALIAGIAVGAFGMYNDVQILKIHAHSTDESLRDKEVSAKEFMKVMNKMEVSLSANTEAINHLKDAVRRLEQPVLYSYRVQQEESMNDRRD